MGIARLNQTTRSTKELRREAGQLRAPLQVTTRSTKELGREAGQLRAPLQVASSSANLPAENSSLKKVKQHRSRDQKPSAQPSAASGIRTATVEQLIDALVVRATGKPNSEIAQIVYEITERLKPMTTG